MATVDPDFARICLLYGEPSPRDEFLSWVVEFSSDSDEDGWTYADMMLKKAAQTAGTDLGYSVDEMDIEFSQDGWTRTRLPNGVVLVCHTTQVSAKPWHRVVRKPTDQELEAWAGRQTAQPESGADGPVVLEVDQESAGGREPDEDFDAHFIMGTAHLLGNLLDGLDVPGDRPAVTENSRLMLTEIQARSLYLTASRSLPKCMGPGELDENDDGDLVRVDPDDCGMPDSICHTCASESRSLPEWHPSRGGSGLY